MECKIDKCTNKIKTIKSMLCEKHYYRLRRTGVTDKRIPTEVVVGSIHKTKNYGSLEVVSYLNSRSVIVRFIKTNHLVTTHSCSITNGQVKDPFYPRVFGVGYNGIGKYSNSINGKATPAYTRWKDMLRRCYCKNTKHMQSSYKYVVVCDEWHDFQNFAPWFYRNNIDGFDLDKDFLSGENKIYSPSTCCFLSPKHNSMLRGIK